MTDTNTKAAVRPIVFNLTPGWLAVLIVIAALTGNCHCNGCGFDKDYVEIWSTSP